MNRIEWLHLAATPLPTLLALILPGPISLALRAGSAARQLGFRLSALGGLLSVLLVLVGVGILWHHRIQQGAIDGRLWLGLVLAGLPSILIVATAALYAVGG